jgi:hypothetical protein
VLGANVSASCLDRIIQAGKSFDGLQPGGITGQVSSSLHKDANVEQRPC